ncbi:MAG: hypothetical protein FJZ96_02950 [Chloroflexi bacterium]|nr:hypothetical protein [Chloroflexota bacterium]
MNNRLGCFTASGIFAALLTAMVIFGVSLAQGGILFSPGALNAQPGAPLGGVTSHAETEGQCKLCHTAFWQIETMDDRCVACHADVSAQLTDSQSLHGVLSLHAPNLPCRACHPEHNGPDASPTVLDNFPHDSLGFSLKGHARQADGDPFSCTDCHANGFDSFDQATCETCHQQDDPVFTVTHVLTFGNDCLACHDGLYTYGSDFDHDIHFQLTGKHTEALCGSCHLAARSLADLQDTPSDCFSCHAQDDAHEGRFGTDCAVCHTPAGWKPALFDHNLAVFKLEGEHVEVACEACHINNVFKGTPTDCYSCHSDDDPHNGQFGTGCEACHTTADWLPATFDHSISNFPLTGAHVGVTCSQCHINNVLTGTPTACVSCHIDPTYHQGLLGTLCTQCHNTTSWVPALYNRAHTFPIHHEGADACRDCHTTSLSAWTCYVCHNQAEMQQKHAEEGISNITNCLQCHPTGREEEGGGD